MTDDFAHFYATSFPRVERAVRAFCRDPDVAYEATQEAFARAFARWSRVRKASFPEAWVAKTAINVTKRYFRRRARASSEPARSSPEPSSDRLEVLDAVRRLPDRQRQAVALHYLTDTPLAGVAEVMGISEGAVKTHLHKARTALKELLGVQHV